MDSRIVLLNQIRPIYSELEIDKYGRDNLVRNIYTKHCISMPILIFSDGFNLFNNIYRNEMDIYITPACLPAAERTKHENSIALILGPHRTNFYDVIANLPQLRELEEGIDIIGDDGSPLRIYICILAFTGDTSHQQTIAGFKRPGGTHKYRCCHKCDCLHQEYGDLQFDIIGHGRYYRKIIQQYQEIQAYPLKTDRAK